MRNPFKRKHPSNYQPLAELSSHHLKHNHFTRDFRPASCHKCAVDQLRMASRSNLQYKQQVENLNRQVQELAQDTAARLSLYNKLEDKLPGLIEKGNRLAAELYRADEKLQAFYKEACPRCRTIFQEGGENSGS